MRKYILLLLIALALVSATFFWFVRSIRDRVYETQLTNMAELAEHDINTIQNYIEDDWRILTNTASKGTLVEIETVEDISAFLRQEQILSDFDDIYFVDEDYHLYSTTGQYPANPETLGTYYTGQDRVMSRFDVMDESLETREETLFSGVELHGVTIGGRHMIEIIGRLDLYKIQERIRISNYNGKGYSSVFDNSGMMIIGINAGGQHVTNYFDYLRTSTDLSDRKIQQIQDKIAEGVEFSEEIREIYSGQVLVVSFQPIQGTGWYFIISVPKSVFSDQNRAMIGLVLIMMAIMLTVTIILLALLFRSRINEAQQEEKEKHREELEKALQQAESANRAKTAFLFNMSHDIRTPMNAVLGLSEIAQNYIGDEDKMRFYMKQISIAGKQLLSIINNILEISRIESDKVDIAEELEDAEELFDSIQTVFSNTSQAKHITMNFHKNLVHTHFFMDRTHVEEVLMNLVSNAVKYTPENGTVDVSFMELAGSDPEHALIRCVIKDNGIGMSEEFQQKLFQRFERERTSTVSGIQGTGLGLAIVKKLIDLMHGTISVESKKDVGTAFTVELPLRVGESPRTNAESANVIDESAFAGKRILLAEDIDINAMIAEELLSSHGFLVERARDGLECLNMMEESDQGYYDLVLMDIQMPNMDGYQSAREIRKLQDPVKSKLPIIAMTANAFVEDKIKVLAAGMNAHVGKPIDVQHLFITLSNVLQYQNYYVDSKELNVFKQKYISLGCPCGYLVYRANESEALVYVDEITAEIYGFDSTEKFRSHVGNSFRGMIYPDDLVGVEEAIARQQAESTNGIDHVTFRIVRGDGSIRKVRDAGYKAFDGSEMLYYVYIADVTEMSDQKTTDEIGS